MDNSNSNDVPDALGIFGKSKPVPVPSVISGHAESPDYSMNYPNRGKCIIFNHKTFEPHTGMNTRNGTDADCARLFCIFRELKFDVRVHTDLNGQSVQKEIIKASKEDHSDNSCFVCVILSHGDNGILFASDGKYSTESVFAPFRGDACPSLAGKPKIFFIQACQGDRLDHGCDVVHMDSGERAHRIPSHADFLTACSTVPGFYSWRNTREGSWFIQALCKAVKEHAGSLHLLDILTVVNRRVAYDFESYVPNDDGMHLKKQVPCVTSTLTRNVRFFPAAGS